MLAASALRFNVRLQRKGESFCRLTGDARDQVEVLVDVKNNEVAELRGSGDKQVRNSGCSMLTLVRK